MKFTLLLVALFAALTHAITINQLVALIPGCAHKCFVENIPKTGCDFIDNGCQCQPKTMNMLTSLITPCILPVCQGEDIGTILKITGEICGLEKANGYTLAGTQTVSVPAAVYSSFSLPVPTAGSLPTARPAIAGAAIAGLAALAL